MKPMLSNPTIWVITLAPASAVLIAFTPPVYCWSSEIPMTYLPISESGTLLR